MAARKHGKEFVLTHWNRTAISNRSERECPHTGQLLDSLPTSFGRGQQLVSNQSQHSQRGAQNQNASKSFHARKQAKDPRSLAPDDEQNAQPNADASSRRRLTPLVVFGASVYLR